MDSPAYEMGGEWPKSQIRVLAGLRQELPGRIFPSMRRNNCVFSAARHVEADAFYHVAHSRAVSSSFSPYSHRGRTYLFYFPRGPISAPRYPINGNISPKNSALPTSAAVVFPIRMRLANRGRFVKF